MHMVSDEDLLARIRTEDREAFRQLTQRYLDKVWRLSYRMLGSRQDAEDVTQEVFVTVWNRREEWREGEASFSTWLYRVVVNRSIDYKRKRRAPHLELHEEIAESGDPSADELLSAQQDRSQLMACLKQLPEKQMLALLLYYYEEMDIAQICVKLESSEDAVRSLLKRGRATMKEMIRDAGSSTQPSAIQGIAP